MSRLLLLSMILACAVGCESNTTVVPPASTPPRTEPDKADVKIRTPRVDIDVDNKGTARDVDIDVKRRPSNR